MAFKLRRMICLGLALLSFVMGFYVIWQESRGRDVSAQMQVSTFMAILATVISFFAIYRCPSCGALLIDRSTGDVAFNLFPQKCSKCSFPLR
jgi:predicted RNA-binding Zn-ribbon protein involved in translation (DUF1610 family)